MSLHRFEIEARLEDGMPEGRVGGGGLQLVTVCLCDEAGEVSDELGVPVVRPAVVTHNMCARAGRPSWCSVCWNWRSWPSGAARRRGMSHCEAVCPLSGCCSTRPEPVDVAAARAVLALDVGWLCGGGVARPRLAERERVAVKLARAGGPRRVMLSADHARRVWPGREVIVDE